MDLGVKLEFPRGIFFRAFEESLIQKAKGVKLGSLTKAGSSPSPWFFLINLWEKMGLPAILYGIEATSISASGINTLERIQGQLIISALKLPWSSPTAIAYVTAGLKPMWYHIYKATVNFYKKIFYERDSNIFHGLKSELEQLGTYLKYCSKSSLYTFKSFFFTTKVLEIYILLLVGSRSCVLRMYT